MRSHYTLRIIVDVEVKRENEKIVVSIDGSCVCGTPILLFVHCVALFLSLDSRIVNRYTRVCCRTRTHTRASAAMM